MSCLVTSPTDSIIHVNERWRLSNPMDLETHQGNQFSLHANESIAADVGVETYHIRTPIHIARTSTSAGIFRANHGVENAKENANAVRVEVLDHEEGIKKAGLLPFTLRSYSENPPVHSRPKFRTTNADVGHGLHLTRQVGVVEM